MSSQARSVFTSTDCFTRKSPELHILSREIEEFSQTCLLLSHLPTHSPPTSENAVLVNNLKTVLSTCKSTLQRIQVANVEYGDALRKVHDAVKALHRFGRK